MVGIKQWEMQNLLVVFFFSSEVALHSIPYYFLLFPIISNRETMLKISKAITITAY